MGKLQKIFYGFAAGLTFKTTLDLINQGYWLLAFVACFFIAIFIIAFFEEDSDEEKPDEEQQLLYFE
jgi:Sec-independent protein secretion pathway component TatC